MSLPRAPVLPPRLIAVGSSTGGPPALTTMIRALGGSLAVPMVVTQHMPKSFIRALADQVGRIGALPCIVAEDGAALRPGCIHLAPGDRHFLIEERDRMLVARLDDGAPEHFCRPAVDPMLRSAAAACRGRVLAIMLTGMGHDGLDGTRHVVAAGGAAIAQDEETSVVWGMPGAVARAGLCRAVLPLPRIGPAILDIMRGAGP